MEAEYVYEDLIWQDSNRMSGAVCFYGTRIPVSFLFDYLRNGSSVMKFASDYRIEEAVIARLLDACPEGLAALMRQAN